jgi:hypothetical protein
MSSRSSTRRSNRPNNRKRKFSVFNRGAIPNQLYSTTFPQQMKVCLKYDHDSNFTTTVSIANDTKFRLNSIFDPDLSGVGHQPQGRDQWNLLYNRYRVDSVRVTIRALSMTSHGMMLCLLPNNSTTTLTDTNQLVESPLAHVGVVGTGTPTTLVKHFDLKVLNGVSKNTYESDDRFQSLFSTNPTETLILHVGYWELGSLASVTASFNITLEYFVTCYDPITVGSS